MRPLLLLVLILSLAGCAALKDRLEGAPVRPAWENYSEATGSGGPSETDALLQYYAHVRQLAPPALEAENEALREIIGSRRSGFNLMRYALFLSLPGSPHQDDSRALAMLEETMRSSPEGKTSLARLAGYLHAVLAEQREQQRMADAQEVRLREARRRADEQERRADEQQRRVDATQRRADEQERRAAELEAKLNALKKIEKSLIQRERR